MGQPQQTNGAPLAVKDFRLLLDKDAMAEASPITASYRQGELIKLMVGTEYALYKLTAVCLSRAVCDELQVL